jgi:hypothetical protein
MSMALAAPFVPGNYHSKFCSADNKTHAAIKQSLGLKPESLRFYNALTSYIKGLCNEKTVGKGDSNLMIDWNCVVGSGAKQPFEYCRSSRGDKKVSQGVWSNAFLDTTPAKAIRENMMEYAVPLRGTNLGYLVLLDRVSPHVANKFLALGKEKWCVTETEWLDKFSVNNGKRLYE